MSTYPIHGRPFEVNERVEAAYAERDTIVDIGVEYAAEMLKHYPPVIVWGACMDQMRQGVPEQERKNPRTSHAISVAAAAFVRLAQNDAR